MPLNGINQSQRFSVMHQTVPSPQPPQGGCTDFVSRGWSSILNDSISCNDIVQKKVAVRMNDLVSQRGRYGVSTIELGSDGCSDNRGHVTRVAADSVEDFRTSLRVICIRKCLI